MMSKQSVGRRTFLSALGRAVMAASFVLFSLAACGDDGPSGGLPGTYTLRTVNDDDLPFIESEDEFLKSEVIAETLVLNANGTFTLTTRYRDTPAGEAPSIYDAEPETGTWEKDGATITFEIDGSFIDGIIDGNEITVDVDGDVFVYQKT
jgi:hypothetical protein